MNGDLEKDALSVVASVFSVLAERKVQLGHTALVAQLRVQRPRVLERRLDLVEIAALVMDASELTISVGHRVLAPQTRVERQRG